eukprot:PhM_4_TR5980/c0_g1_i1/m.99457/K14816/REI1; pre-60S factor REI1
MNSTPLPHRHTCSTCKMTFEHIAAVREHYGSDLHLRNVKRRVGGDMSTLPQKPVQSTTASVARYYCSVCKKYFNSVQTLTAHVASKAHKLQKDEQIRLKEEKAGRTDEPDAAAVTADESAARTRDPAHDQVELTSCHCLFCPEHFETEQANVAHMSESHDFKVPMGEKVTDMTGLLSYLARKVNGLMCIVCGDKSRDYNTLTAVRMHMNDSRHTSIKLDEEYEEFYVPGTFDEPTISDDVRHTTRVGRELVRRGEVVHHDRANMQMMAPQRRQTELQVAQEKRVIVEKKQVKESRRDVEFAKKASVEVAVKANKFHKKGYEGDYGF